MATISPSQLFPGYDSDGTSITIPLTALPGLSVSEADANTGDGREICRVMCETIHSKISSLATSERPSKMTTTKSNPAGVSATQIRQSYSFSFDVEFNPSTLSMANEPNSGGSTLT